MNKLLEACKKSIGYKEGAGNDNVYGKKYGRNGESWCAFWICYKCDEIGNKFFTKIKDKSDKWFLAGATEKYCGYCPSIFTFAKSRGLLKTDPIKTPPSEGDVILFNMRGRYPDGNYYADHIGVLDHYDSKTGIFHTVEGNTSDSSKGSQSNGDTVSPKKRYIQNVKGWFTVETRRS